MDLVRRLRRVARVARRVTVAGAAVAAALVVTASPAKAAPPVADGVYLLVNVNSGQCLNGLGFNSGPVLFQQRCGATVNGIFQRWRLQNIDGGSSYKIISWATSGICAAIGGSRTDDGAGAIQWTCVNIADQIWRVAPSGAGYSFVNANSGKCLAIGGSRTDEGAWAIQWTCVGIADQQWVLRPV